jgi:hypothetical protein
MGIFRAVVAIVSAAVTATGLTLDIFQIGGFDPKWWTLIAFGVFCGFMIWIVVNFQGEIKKLNSGRPLLTVGDQTQITKLVDDDQARKRHAVFNIAYKNIGQKPAYQLCLRIGFAQYAAVSEFKLLSDRTSVNRQDPNVGEIGESYTFTVGYQEGDSKPTELSKVARILIYCGLSYSDAPVGGHSYCDEWWFSYGFGDTQFGSMNAIKKDELEPYVRLALTNLKK